MKDQELARHMADANHRVPVVQATTKGNMVGYTFPEEFDSLISETSNHAPRHAAALRRQVYSRHGGWGVPERMDQDQNTGRALLWVQLYKGRRPPGPPVQVMVKFGEVAGAAAAKASYFVEYIFRADNEPDLDEPRLGTLRQQALDVDRARREQVRQQKISENEKRRYRRTARKQNGG